MKRLHLNRDSMTELFTLVHRTLRIAEEMDRQPRLDVVMNNMKELILTPHNEAGAVAANVIQLWLGLEPHRTKPGDSVTFKGDMWFGAQAHYPFPNGSDQRTSGGDRPDSERAGSAEPRSESPSYQGIRVPDVKWERREGEWYIEEKENPLLSPPP